MAQHDFNIANQTFPATRTDLNNALEALATLSSGPTAPTTTYTNMLWYDTGNNILKMRTEADDAWINVFYLDQSANAFRLLDDTQVTDTSGTQTGLLGDQATSAWETGTATTESLVSPAKVKAAIDALNTQPTTAGAVGTSVFARSTTASDVAFGNTRAGSALVPTSAASTNNIGGPYTFSAGSGLSGTWRCMGYYDYSEEAGNTVVLGATLWLRIS